MVVDEFDQIGGFHLMIPAYIFENHVFKQDKTRQDCQSLSMTRSNLECIIGKPALQRVGEEAPTSQKVPDGHSSPNVSLIG